MLPFRGVRSFGTSMLAASALLTCLAAPAAAQDPADPNPGAITVTGGIDFTNAYLFRGIRQETEGVIIWPYVDLGVALYQGEGSLKSFGVNVGLWNSLHAGSTTGTIGPSRELWYESDFYTSASFAVSGGVTTSVTYTAYTSPNSSFSTVKELSFKVAVDDSQYGRFSLKPYGLIASEFDTGTGTGQADGGARRGTYLELGIAPGGYAVSGATLAFPVKVGLGLNNYYEAPLPVPGEPDTYLGNAGKFGFASVAALATVPFTSQGSRFGSWNIHGGAEFVKLGGVTRRYMKTNGIPLLNDDGEYRSTQMIYTMGLGFSY